MYQKQSFFHRKTLERGDSNQNMKVRACSWNRWPAVQLALGFLDSNLPSRPGSTHVLTTRWPPGALHDSKVDTTSSFAYVRLQRFLKSLSVSISSLSFLATRTSLFVLSSSLRTWISCSYFITRSMNISRSSVLRSAGSCD